MKQRTLNVFEENIYLVNFIWEEKIVLGLASIVCPYLDDIFKLWAFYLINQILFPFNK